IGPRARNAGCYREWSGILRRTAQRRGAKNEDRWITGTNGEKRPIHIQLQIELPRWGKVSRASAQRPGSSHRRYPEAPDTIVPTLPVFSKIWATANDWGRMCHALLRHCGYTATES